MYNSSDALFLTVLILYKDWASLQDMICNGDVINHSIFTVEKINHALSVLIANGFAEIDCDKKMHSTEKSYKFCDKTFIKAGLFTKTDRILFKLKKSQYFKDYKMINYFSENEIMQAYNQYIGK